jgi:peptide/nickel transport system permease protein
MSTVLMEVGTKETRTRRMRRRLPVLTTISFGILIFFVVGAIFAPWLAPHDPNKGDLLHSLASPSAIHPLGTDGAGRDVLSRVMYGARLSLLGPLLVVLLAALIGVPLGVAAGYAGGWLDTVLSRTFDVVFAFPALLLAAVIVATFSPGFKTTVLAVTVVYVPLMARVVRASVMVERRKPYVDALRVQGFGAWRITRRHIAPSLTKLVVGTATLYFGYALLDLAGLSFLGFGVQPPTADWGSMLWYANQSVFVSVVGVIAPAAAIVLSVVSLNIIGDWIVQRAEDR